VLAADGTLAGVAWLVFRYSVKLPIGPFFAVTSVLLAALAVVFAGQGVAALQEAGIVSITPVSSFAAPGLGVFPTLQTLAAQAAMALVVVLSFYLAARNARTAA
jgi:high-affinity iron transporter